MKKYTLDEKICDLRNELNSLKTFVFTGLTAAEYNAYQIVKMTVAERKKIYDRCKPVRDKLLSEGYQEAEITEILNSFYENNGG